MGCTPSKRNTYPPSTAPVEKSNGITNKASVPVKKQSQPTDPAPQKYEGKLFVQKGFLNFKQGLKRLLRWLKFPEFSVLFLNNDNGEFPLTLSLSSSSNKTCFNTLLCIIKWGEGEIEF